MTVSCRISIDNRPEAADGPFPGGAPHRRECLPLHRRNDAGSPRVAGGSCHQQLLPRRLDHRRGDVEHPLGTAYPRPPEWPRRPS